MKKNICMYNWMTLPYRRNYRTTVHQLHFNNIIFLEIYDGMGDPDEKNRQLHFRVISVPMGSFKLSG